MRTASLGGLLTVTGAVVGLLMAAAPAAAAAGPAPVEQRPGTAVTADALPTVQIDNGVVWSQDIVGDTVYAGGSFANVRPAGAAAGTSLTHRANMLAYNLNTGNLITSFAPALNGPVKVVRASPDGSRIYVGGTFTTANGQPRTNLAAYSTSTGALIDSFKPVVTGSFVNALAVTANTVYVGGILKQGNGVARRNLLAVSTSSGALLNWAPTTDKQVDTMVLAPGNTKLIVGGRFGMVNNQPQRGMAALNLTTGAILPWEAPNVVKNGTGTGPYAGQAGIYALSTDGQAVYGTGWVFSNLATGNLEGSFSAWPGSGNIKWLEDCHGDTYGVYSDATTVYEVGHAHDCVTVGGFPNKGSDPPNQRNAVAFTAAVRGTLSRSPTAGPKYQDWSGQWAPAMINWFPDWTNGTFTGQGQAGWTITGNGSYVVIGGEFPAVNGVRQQGLVRFARPSDAPNKQGPRLQGANWLPTLVSSTAGAVKIAGKANWDRDDLTLTYRIIRDDTTTVKTISATSTFWNLPTLSYTDTGLTPGSTHNYRLQAIDPSGNQVSGDNKAITVKS